MKLELQSYAANSHQGPFLNLNEDSIEVDFAHNLYMVFDGFGGSNVGDKAVQIVKDCVKKFFTRIASDPEATLPFFYSPRYLLEGNALINSMYFAHETLKKDNSEKDMNNRGGTSAIFIAQSDHLLTFASTGNCKAYFYTRGHLKTLIEPDNFEFVAGNYSSMHSLKTAPSSGFGLFNDLQFQVKELKPNKGDIIFVATDGLYSRIDDVEVKHLLQKDKSSHQSKIEEFFEMANSRGNLDNQSALILEY
jgi:serine/threonine protein phosphatase PrpC